jgi:hypothetical protein
MLSKDLPDDQKGAPHKCGGRAAHLGLGAAMSTGRAAASCPMSARSVGRQSGEELEQVDSVIEQPVCNQDRMMTGVLCVSR